MRLTNIFNFVEDIFENEDDKTINLVEVAVVERLYYEDHFDWNDKMKYLYQGTLEPERLNDAINELPEIKKELEKLSPQEVVFDIEDLESPPPWGNNVSSEITNLSNYFVTSEGKLVFFNFWK